MCGILAIVQSSLDPEQLRLLALERSRTLRHRGPDWNGVYVQKGKSSSTALAHERLAIVDPTSADSRTGDFFAARDPLGICSMYVGYASDGSIWFASEMKALIEDCEQVSVFPPGHYFYSALNNGQGALKRYYNPSWWGPESPIPSRPCDLTQLREALEKSVRKTLMCDVPFGLMLSGGLDSSLVAAIAVREFAKISASEIDSHLWTHQLHSFSIGLKDSKDLQFATKVAEGLGTVHHAFTFELKEGLDALEDVIRLIETYDVTTIRAAVPMYLLCRLIKSLGIKVVLTGEGADEVFGGYLYFHKAPTKEAFFRELQRKLDLLQYYDVLRGNKASAAWGVEARVPFLDREFLDYAMTLDPAAKMCTEGRIEKQILRDAFKGYLPDEVLYRQKEQFSDGVGYDWITSLKAYADKRVTDTMMSNASVLFPTNTPTTKEGYLYRMIFAKYYNKGSAARTVHTGPSVACSTETALEWDEQFKRNPDQSGRSVSVHHAPVCHKHPGESSARLVDGIAADYRKAEGR
ncbi:asparagine synthetase [Cystoisospora suis]|uniref:asparagine synthase (glutamine-hydrolyzing) n=1 Tax=Cystoisospora suis TaxID=483139 RepID=A0A2C6LJ15_9APIC|nr:asparagine synthetase [Cystoisospora suis]